MVTVGSSRGSGPDKVGEISTKPLLIASRIVQMMLKSTLLSWLTLRATTHGDVRMSLSHCEAAIPHTFFVRGVIIVWQCGHFLEAMFEHTLTGHVCLCLTDMVMAKQHKHTSDIQGSIMSSP